MAKCKLCNQSGIFTKVNELGICKDCATQFSLDLLQTTQSFNDTLREIDTEPPWEKRLPLFAIAFDRLNKMILWEQKGISVITPSAETIKPKLQAAYDEYLQEIMPEKKQPLSVPPDHIEEIKMLKREGRYQEAIDLLKECIKDIKLDDEGKLPYWHFEQLAIVYRKLGDIEAANKYENLTTDIILKNYFDQVKVIAEMPSDIREKYYPNGAIKTIEVKKALAKRGLSK